MIWVLDKSLENRLTEIARDEGIDPDALLDEIVTEFIQRFDEKNVAAILRILRPDISTRN